MIFLYDIHRISAADQSAQVLRLSSSPYTTKRSDMPSNAYYSDILKRGGSVNRYMFGFGETFGQTEIGAGSIVAANDGTLDQYIDDGFDFQKIEVYTVENESTPFSEAVLFATFICEKTVFRYYEVEFIIRDPLYLLNRPIQDATFLGDNDGDADDIEGTANDLQGQKKPVAIGTCYHVPLTLLNSTSLIYGCNFGKDGDPAPLAYDDIFDKLNPLVFDGDDADLATLSTATITDDYRTSEADGLARLDASPDGIVTANVSEGATSGDRTAAQCVKRAITNYAIGFTPAFNAASFVALDSADSSEVGFYSDGEDMLFDVCSAIAGSIDAAILVDKNLEFFVSQLTAPELKTAIETIEINDIVDQGQGFEQVDIDDVGGGIPSYKTTTSYKHYFHRFTETEIAGILSEADRIDGLQEWRKVEAETASVQDTYKSSQPIEIASYLADKTAAETRNTARHNLRKIMRTMWLLPLERNTALEIGDVIEVKIDRFGMTAGKNFVILGYEWREITENKVVYLIYG